MNGNAEIARSIGVIARDSLHQNNEDDKTTNRPFFLQIAPFLFDPFLHQSKEDEIRGEKIGLVR